MAENTGADILRQRTEYLYAHEGMPWSDAEAQARAEHPELNTTTPEAPTVQQEQNTPEPAGDTPRLAKLWNVADMERPRPIQWLARHRVPRGAITVLVGDEGIGKSLLWVWLASKITTGQAAPEFGIKAGKPGHIVLFLAENGFTDMDLPRMEAAGVDTSYVHPYCTDADGSGTPPLDLFAVNDIMHADYTPSLIVADPWLDMVPSDLSVKDGQQAKRALRPWRELAVKTNAGVLLVCHTNRTDSANVRDKYGATAELRKTARMTLFAQIDEESERLTIGPEKSNVVARGVPASEFTIHGVPKDGFEDDVPVLEFAGVSEKTAADLVVEKWEADRPEQTTRRTAAQKWLESYLKAHGPSKRQDVISAAAEHEYSPKTLLRSLKKLGGTSKDLPVKPRQTLWSLPVQDTSDSRDSQDTDQEQDPISLEGVPTDPTVTDLHKRNVSTRQSGQSGQSGHLQKHRVPTANLTTAETVLDYISPDVALSAKAVAQGVPGVDPETVLSHLDTLLLRGLVMRDQKGNYLRKVAA